MAIFNETMVGGINAKDCTADASKILNGYTAAVGKEIVTGIMPNNGNVDSAIANGVLKEGYTSGGAIANLSAENIKNGVTIGGKTGIYSGKVAVGICQKTTDLSQLIIQHNLGYEPKHIMFYPDEQMSTYNNGYVVGGHYCDYNMELESFSGENTIDSKITYITKSSNTGYRSFSSTTLSIQISSEQIIINEPSKGRFGFPNYYFIAY